MKRSTSSKRWLERQQNDVFVKLSKKDNYRSRAAYKLLEIQQKYKIIKKGYSVLDLGAAPGSWSEVVSREVGSNGKVVAVDLLEMEAIDGVDSIQGDFCDDNVVSEIRNLIGSNKVNLVISDMSPNFSGISSADGLRAIYLAERALEFSIDILHPNGCFLIKLFQGKGFSEYLTLVKSYFGRVIMYKPKASRQDSSEVYCLASMMRNK